jgi:hypothetical protein
MPFLNEGYSDFINPNNDMMFNNNNYNNNNMMNNNQRNMRQPNYNNNMNMNNNNNNMNYIQQNQNSYSCPENFLEDPLFLVRRNVHFKGWYIKENDRLIAQMNSQELFIFLEGRLKTEQQGLSNLWIFDSMSDIYYTPITLYEVLKENENILIPQQQKMFNPMQFQNNVPFNNNNNMNRRNNNQEDFMNKNEQFVNQPPFANPYMNQMQGQFTPPNHFPQQKFNIPQNQALNVNMNINLLQGELNVNSIYAPQSNNFNQVNNQYYQNVPNESVYYNNLNNIYNSMKVNPNMKRVEKKK